MNLYIKYSDFEKKEENIYFKIKTTEKMKGISTKLSTELYKCDIGNQVPFKSKERQKEEKPLTTYLG